MLEKRGFSAMRPIVVESVRKRILPPLGSWAKSQTGERNRSFKRNGKRRSAGLSSLNQGNPKTSRRTSGKAMRWRTGICSALAGRKVVALSTTGSIRSQGVDRTRISCKAVSPERCVRVRDDVKMIADDLSRARSRTVDDDTRQHVEAILALLRKAAGEAHTYVKFY